MNILFLNIFFYLLWLLYSYFVSRKDHAIYQLIFLFYTLVALLGWLTHSNGIYRETFDYYNVDKLNLLPYLLCFATVLIITHPFKKFNPDELLSNVHLPNNKVLFNFVKISFYIIVLNFLCFFYLFLTVGVYDTYADAYSDSSAGETLYKFSSSLMNFLYFNILVSLSDVLIPLMLFVALYLVVKKRHVSFLLFCIIATYIMQIFPLIISAARGSIFFLSMRFLFIIMLFYKHLSHRIRKTMIMSGLGFIAILANISLIITMSRMGDVDSNEGINGILRYFGESFPNLGFRVWGYEINHPYGARLFPSLGSLIGFDISYIYGDRYAMFDFWELYVGIPMLNFKTIFGDLYVEFGIIGAFIVIGMIYFLAKAGLRSKLPLMNFITSYYLFYICIYGLFSFGFREHVFLSLLKTIIFLIILNKFIFKSNDDKRTAGIYSNTCI